MNKPVSAISYIQNQVEYHRILHTVALELTYKCNLDCFFCYNDRNKKGTPLSLEDYQVLLQDLAEMQTLNLMLTGGEPMIHPHFFAIGAITRELGFITRIRTNGHSLSKNVCRRLKQEVDPYEVEVSLHGATPEVHDKQTRICGSFDRLVSNIGHAKEAGLRIRSVTTPTKWNEHQIPELFDLTESLDIPLRFQGPVSPRDNGDNSPLSIQPLQGTWNKIHELHTKRKENYDKKTNSADTQYENDRLAEQMIKLEKRTCSVGVDGVDIDPYGNVQACMHLQESAGNIHHQSIKDIWADSALFARARSRAEKISKSFGDIPVRQFGAPLYCLAVEENFEKKFAGPIN